MSFLSVFHVVYDISYMREVCECACMLKSLKEILCVSITNFTLKIKKGNVDIDKKSSPFIYANYLPPNFRFRFKAASSCGNRNVRTTFIFCCLLYNNSKHHSLVLLCWLLLLVVFVHISRFPNLVAFSPCNTSQCVRNHVASLSL